MKFFLPLLVIGIIVSVWVIVREPDQTPVTRPDVKTGNSDISAYNTTTVSYHDTDYIIHYTNISHKTISVIPNFDTQVSGSSIVDDYACTAAINGGFYTQEDTPLGLFRVNGTQLGTEKKESNLLTAFFYLDDTGSPHIDWDYPESAQTVIQSGPYYVSRSTISTVNDKPARRMVMIQTRSGEYYIAAITTKDLTTSGPYLSDIGAILFSVSDIFTPTAVLNLDGGAASYYLGSDKYELSELTHVGSILCIGT